MKLGKELTGRVVEIPPVYISTIDDVLLAIREDRLKSLTQLPEDKLLALQKSVLAIDDLRKTIANAYKEAELYRNT